MHVLVAFEADYRIYQNGIASILRELHPHLEVAEAVLGELKEEVARLVPDLVICDRSRNAPDAGAVHAWLKLPTTGGDRSAELCLDGEYSKLEDPDQAELLRVLDETERLLRTKVTLRRC